MQIIAMMMIVSGRWWARLTRAAGIVAGRLRWAGRGAIGSDGPSANGKAQRGRVQTEFVFDNDQPGGAARWVSMGI